MKKLNGKTFGTALTLSGLLAILAIASALAGDGGIALSDSALPADSTRLEHVGKLKLRVLKDIPVSAVRGRGQGLVAILQNGKTDPESFNGKGFCFITVVKLNPKYSTAVIPKGELFELTGRVRVLGRDLELSFTGADVSRYESAVSCRGAPTLDDTLDLGFMKRHLGQYIEILPETSSQ